MRSAQPAHHYRSRARAGSRCGAERRAPRPARRYLSSHAGHVVRQIKRLEEQVGITHFNASFWFADMDQKRVLKSMELFAKHVMPAV